MDDESFNGIFLHYPFKVAEALCPHGFPTGKADQNVLKV